ncbi:MAG: hypothetical protein MHMPM18_001526 [Marteilia pararefringens]
MKKVLDKNEISKLFKSCITAATINAIESPAIQQKFDNFCRNGCNELDNVIEKIDSTIFNIVVGNLKNYDENLQPARFDLIRDACQVPKLKKTMMNNYESFMAEHCRKWNFSRLNVDKSFIDKECELNRLRNNNFYDPIICHLYALYERNNEFETYENASGIQFEGKYDHLNSVEYLDDNILKNLENVQIFCALKALEFTAQWPDKTLIIASDFWALQESLLEIKHDKFTRRWRAGLNLFAELLFKLHERKVKFFIVSQKISIMNDVRSFTEKIHYDLPRKNIR